MEVRMWLFLFGVAVAGSEPCEWPEVEKVFATMTTLSINGEMRSVKGKTNRLAMENDLRTCGYDTAADELRKWRSMRRVTNWVAGVSLVVWIPLLPGVIATPFTATAAGNHREVMETTLRGADAD